MAKPTRPGAMMSSRWSEAEGTLLLSGAVAKSTRPGATMISRWFEAEGTLLQSGAASKPTRTAPRTTSRFPVEQRNESCLRLARPCSDGPGSRSPHKRPVRAGALLRLARALPRWVAPNPCFPGRPLAARRAGSRRFPVAGPGTARAEPLARSSTQCRAVGALPARSRRGVVGQRVDRVPQRWAGWGLARWEPQQLSSCHQSP